MPNRTYPDKAIDIIDHCGARAKVKFWEMDQELKQMQKNLVSVAEETGQVSMEDIDDLNDRISEWEEKLMKTDALVDLSHLKEFFEHKGSPLNRHSTIDSLRLELKENIVGNLPFINSLVKNLRYSTLKISQKHNSSSPDVFLINGNDSTGKTLLCETIKNSLERSGANVLSYNGTQFSDGYAPYKILSQQNNNTSIAEKVLIHPNSVIIIDDFDKIDGSCDSLISQIFKEGKLQMPNGDIADFSNCKIILTSSVTSSSSMGFNNQKSPDKTRVVSKIETLIPNQFSLAPLDKKGLRRVLYNRLQVVKNAALLQNSQLHFNFGFLKSFVEKACKDSSSVKCLNEKIEKELIPQLSEKIFAGESKIELCS
jgi:ATP-dependent Clp protease ATP-binding subunit ClpA